MSMKKSVTLAGAATLAALPALANQIDLIRPDAPELAAFGTLPIGVRTLHLVNPDQIDVVNVVGVPTVNELYNGA